MKRFLIPFISTALNAHFTSAEVSFSKTQLYEHYISEGAAIADLNGDEQLDIVSGSLWWKGPDFKKSFAYKPVKHFPLKGAKPTLANYTDTFFLFPDEFTDDQWEDLLKVGIAGRPGHVYLNPAEKPFPIDNEEHSCSHCVAHKSVCHESPQYLNVTGDEEKELLFFTNRRIALARPAQDIHKPWKVSYISDASKPKKPYVHGLGAGDVNGDGLLDILEKEGWWEQPKDWDHKTLWTFHEFAFAPGKGGAQMYAYDFNGDGLNDVATALDAHGYGLVWYEQVRTNDTIAFQQHVIMPSQKKAKAPMISFSQPHAMLCEDVDGDGIKDLITGKTYYAHLGKDPGAEDPAVFYWFKTERQTDGSVIFQPHQIDDDSGIGRQIASGDLNGDGKLDLVTSNKKGVFLFIQN